MTQTPTNVPALDKAFAILDYVTESPRPVSAAQIAKDLNLPKSSTHNLVNALLQKGVLRKDENNLFYLGSYLLYWAGKFEEQQEVIALFNELILSEPVLALNTITLSTLDYTTGQVVYLACHESPLPLGFAFRVGMRVPALFSATGKAMMSTLPAEEVKAIYANGLPQPLTPYGVHSFEMLFNEFSQVNNTRISLDNGQLRIGMYCLGTYIRNMNGDAIAGVAASFPYHEYEQKKEEVSTSLIALANKIEQRLGFNEISETAQQ